MLPALLLSLALGSTSAEANTLWSRDGHRLVCEIAWRYLKPEAKRFATQLRQGETGTFAESCTWADDMVDERQETYAYHFINIPPRQRSLNLARDCRAPKRCVPWAVKHYATILADTTKSKQQRAEALKYLGHFVADVHQPLHAGRPQDRGGNEIYLSFFGDAGSRDRRMKLHGVWDSGILRRAHVRWPGSAAELANGITSAEAAAWSNSDVLGWTMESYRLNEEFVYSATSGSDIGETYYNRALQISKERIQQAGIRLAFLLNEAARGRATFNF